MPESNTNSERAGRIFSAVSRSLGAKLMGPRFDFDRDSYKARIQDGALKGRLLFISVEKLEDWNGENSERGITEQLLASLKEELARGNRQA
jgi:hypothetical protein